MANLGYSVLHLAHKFCAQFSNPCPIIFSPSTESNPEVSMAPPTSESTNQESIVRQKQKRGAPLKFLFPLIYAPVLPLIRLSLRYKPVLRDRLFTAVLAGAFAHGCYLVTDLYDAESK